ncbi:MAG: transglutaminase domain-containing protein [Dongiaceae bacterium]
MTHRTTSDRSGDGPLAYYCSQTALTELGPHAAAIASLPDDVPSLVGVVQGLLIHGDWLDLYHLTDADFADAARATHPIATRLDIVLALDAAPLEQPRPPRRRSVSTCRDYALMLTALLRAKAVPARVRCGFATYFDEGRFEDHWVCEYWRCDEARWAIADAQLDAEHRAHLAIGFDGSDLPTGAFLNAAAAWQLYRSGKEDAARFGHGEATGAWFLRINLARDLLALRKQETSLWDRWREAPADARVTGADAVWAGDTLADLIVRIESGHPPDDAIATAAMLEPFWLRPAA